MNPNYGQLLGRKVLHSPPNSSQAQSFRDISSVSAYVNLQSFETSSWISFAVSSNFLRQVTTRTVQAVRLDGYIQLGSETLASYDVNSPWISLRLSLQFEYVTSTRQQDIKRVEGAYVKPRSNLQHGRRQLLCRDPRGSHRGDSLAGEVQKESRRLSIPSSSPW